MFVVSRMITARSGRISSTAIAYWRCRSGPGGRDLAGEILAEQPGAAWDVKAVDLDPVGIQRCHEPRGGRHVGEGFPRESEDVIVGL